MTATDLSASRCWAEISGDALRQNAKLARKLSGPNTALVAVIKANGYGHGLSEVARALARDAEIFGVANLDEGIVTREVAPDHDVLILGPSLPAERRRIVEAGFIPSVSNYEEASAFDEAAKGATVRINLVVDTGMGRLGCREHEALSLLRQIMSLARIRVHSVSTHLPVADEDADFTRRELEGFTNLIAEMRAAVPGDYKVHALLSAGVLDFHERPFDIVRAGLMLYGISPLPKYQATLRPALALKSRIVLVRELPAGCGVSYGRTFITPRAMRVATVSAGYADGFPRSLSGKGAVVLIGGHRCAVLGRVTMDMIVVDLSAVPEAGVGDEVVLIGRQGDAEILATELAQMAGTISWEILTGIGSRVRRVYL